MKIRIRKGNKLGTLTTDRLIQDDQIQKISRSPWSLWPSGRESEVLRLDSSWGLRIFYFSYARDKKKKSFSILQRALD